jgi:hypothetical protein
MAEIGYGYGSEWQLMRFMARHRKLLEEAIRKSIGGLNEENVFDWYDFKFGGSGITSDNELKGLSFLGENQSIKGYIKSDWQSWDAIFRLDDTFYLVEAKAHIEEMRGSCSSDEAKSQEKIKDYICNNLEKLGISINRDMCLVDYYQLANRLATAAFLRNNGIAARCLYIYFLNGYEKPNDIKNTSLEMFVDEINKEKAALGLKVEELNDFLFHVFIDAKTGEVLDPKHK